MLAFMFKHWIMVIIGIIILWIILAGTAVLEAWLDFDGRPKEPMFWCHKHGAFRKIHALPLFPELQGTADNSFVCPTCYRDACFTQPDKKLKRG
jgi:hypothetical protein